MIRCDFINCLDCDAMSVIVSTNSICDSGLYATEWIYSKFCVVYYLSTRAPNGNHGLTRPNKTLA